MTRCEGAGPQDPGRYQDRADACEHSVERGGLGRERRSEGSFIENQRRAFCDAAEARGHRSELDRRVIDAGRVLLRYVYLQQQRRKSHDGRRGRDTRRIHQNRRITSRTSTGGNKRHASSTSVSEGFGVKKKASRSNLTYDFQECIGGHKMADARTIAGTVHLGLVQMREGVAAAGQ
ncbi:hypothetical protein EYF80_035896 [Liparis tanakae]|uniref:Uncharacterized protein n=1 Tax=Liparis tanakae TaxID=230148 RepID=A0A4Z2GKS2_9TELE|nr:hypothetical protein EYF80_035896 [Liparis tanakae]